MVEEAIHMRIWHATGWGFAKIANLFAFTDHRESNW